MPSQDFGNGATHKASAAKGGLSNQLTRYHDSMRQVLQHVRDGRTELADVPTPACARGGILVRNQASLISAGTERMVIEFARRSLLGKARERPDLVRQVLDKVRRDGIVATAQTVFARLDDPIPLGYSCAGVAVEVGVDASEFISGDRVACAGMGYASHADYVYVPRNLAVLVPDDVSSEDASYVTVGAIALHGCRVADVRVGEVVVVIGLGLIGQLSVQLLAASGCRVIGIDPDGSKGDLALAGGAMECTPGGDAAEAIVARLTAGAGADAVIVAAASDSAEPLELAGRLARDRAVISVVGAVKMEVSRKLYYEKELSLRLSRSYGPGRYDAAYEEGGIDYPIGYVRWTERRNMEEFIRLIASGRVKPSTLTTHRFEIGRATDAYSLLTHAGGERVGGIVLTYGAASTVPTRTVHAPSEAPARPGEVRIGVIGAGKFAKSVLLPRLRRLPDVRIGAVANARGHTASAVAAKFGAAVATTDANAVLTAGDIGAVLIATRHASHASLAASALRAGKSVFCEKPLALDAQSLDLVLDAARDCAGVLFVGFNRRFSSHARAVRAALRPNEAVALTYRVNAGAIPANSWIQDAAEGGGRVIGEACHFIDLMQYLAGDDLPVEAFAHATPAATRDTLTVTLKFARGSVASLCYASTGDRSYPKERVEVFGGGVSALIDDFRHSETWNAGHRTRHRSWKQDKGFDGELDAFVRVARGGGEWPISLASLAATTRATFAIMESLRTGRPAAVSVDVR